MNHTVRLGVLTPSSNTALEPLTSAIAALVPGASAHFSRFQVTEIALDSRALAHFRLGNLAAAKADLDAALLAEPYLTESRLLRGIIRKAMGEPAGKDDIALALKMQPSLAKAYKAYKAWGG